MDLPWELQICLCKETGTWGKNFNFDQSLAREIEELLHGVFKVFVGMILQL